ncbi:DNA-processing protein DprA [Zavarzinia sp. CC-PAN008]|uniref:DNA-processing protein DprA n=1 Tax=Zavarzinia sp. CC-PAN008 TaxID=3243332 RepID=UPI003F7499F4
MPAAQAQVIQDDARRQLQRQDALRLIRTPGVGPVAFRQLLARYRTPSAALAALPGLARRGGRREAPAVPPVAAAQAEMEANERAGARLLIQGDAEYPAALASLESAPPVLSLRGRAELLARPTVAIVGARNASAAGLRLAERMAADLAQAGLVIASGLARGIDTAAHRGSLAGGTIAVIAGGIDTVFPPENAQLQEQIAEEGVLLAEMPPGNRPMARHFPRRNRIIAGLSLGVVVVEAAARSGSLGTARLALDAGREVLAVPGSPLDPRCEGTNGLIREGATLTRHAADVMEVVGALAQTRIGPLPRHARLLEELRQAPDEAFDADGGQARIAELLGPTPVSVDTIVEHSGLTLPIVLTILLEFELAGRVTRQSGNRVSWA